MVKQASGSRPASSRRGRKYVENPGLKRESNLPNPDRSVYIRRFWLFLLTAFLLAVGLSFALNIRLF